MSGRLLVGDAHAVGVLELLHQRVEVQRVGLQVLLETGLLADLLGIDVELVGQVGLDQFEYLLARSLLLNCGVSVAHDVAAG